MRASRRADTPSALAINPNNLADSAMRRVKLLNAFQELDEDDQADLLEAAETMVLKGADDPGGDASRVLNMIYIFAGWGQFRK